MLFNSYIFLFGFLPVFLVGFWSIRKYSSTDETLACRNAKIWLVLASLFFYGWWNPAFLTIFMASVVLNFGLGRTLIRGGKYRKLAVIAGILLNMGMLGYFKYSAFIEHIFGQITGSPAPVQSLVLPLGISFFTFVQLAFLVDAYRGEVHATDFLDYILFVCFFPHLIAGPIVHHDVLIKQFRDVRGFILNHRNFSVGLLILTAGLVKKVFLADKLEPFAASMFDAPTGARISSLDAWLGALAYAFQLYFDFSGYSDMAIGLSKMLGVRLPMNFNSPYKSENIIEFWRRWHITLGEFLRDYVYIPLGGNRKGAGRRYVNLFLTMLIGGLWHGAGYTFIIWGALHGTYLCINHFWQKSVTPHWRMPHFASCLITFIAVVFAWCFFRAPDLTAGVSVCQKLLFPFGRLHVWLFADSLRELKLFLGLAAGIAFFAPNLTQLLSEYDPVTISSRSLKGAKDGEVASSSWSIPFNAATAVLVATGLLVVLVMIAKPSKFIYYQF